MMAMTMFDRARWTRKPREAEIFRQWLVARLTEAGLFEETERGGDKETRRHISPIGPISPMRA